MTDGERLVQLIAHGPACITIATHEEQYALGLARDAAMRLQRPLWLWSVSGGVQDALFAGRPPIPDTEKVCDGLVHFASLSDRPLCLTLDLVPHLRDERNLRTLRNLLRQFEGSGSQLIMLDYSEEAPSVIASHAAPFELSLPEEPELEEIIRETLRKAHRSSPIEIEISRSMLATIIRNLRGLTRRQVQQIVGECVAEDRRFDADDLNTVLACKRRTLHHGGLLEYVETPVDLDEIGGLRRLKSWLQMRAASFSEDAREFGLTTPRGVLMLGVQGAGKSLCAKAIATAWKRPLLRMDVGALYDRYVGESERRLRDALRQAEMMAPLVLWIDEIEKAFASAASRSTDGGLSQRMFGTLLTWMQEHTHPAFLVATANDIEALPPELLRKGRFDEIFFVDLPEAGVRREIFAIHLKKRKRPVVRFDLEALAAAAEGYSGAEIEQAVIGGLHAAYAGETELSTDHVLEALRNSPPLSVTMAERLAGLRAWAEGRCVPAD